MTDVENKDFYVLNDVASYVDNNKKYKRPLHPDVDTIEINVDSLKSDNKTLRFSPEKINREEYSTQSYFRTGTGFSNNKTHSRKSEGKLIEERIISGQFLESVSVFDWGGDFGFYEKFRHDAEKYREVKGKPCPHVPFFSYVPQYSQMKPAQMSYYFYLRDELRSGHYPLSDLSYVLLYVYELINLGDDSDNHRDIQILCALWSAYRTVYPVLDKYLSEWVADYCLIHSVDLPSVVTPFLPQVASRSSLKEFFLEEAYKASSGDISVFTECLIAACSDYVPERSRYLTDDPSLLLKLKSIFKETVSKLIAEKSMMFSPDRRNESLVKRDAYSGSLCSYSVKKRLFVKVCSPFRSQDVRREVTEILRYCENIVRKNAGIRSRLTVDLKSEIKNIIANGSSSRSDDETYLALYDAPEGELSIEGAINLENISWDSTERLVGDIYDDGTEEEHEEEPIGTISFSDDLPSENAAHDKSTDDTSSFFDPRYNDVLLKIISANGENSPSFESFCRDAGIFPDSAASEINEYFTDVFGDIVLENKHGKYFLIEDYRDQISELLKMGGDPDETG